MKHPVYFELWMMLHWLADIIEAVFYFGLELREKLRCYTENIIKLRHPKRYLEDEAQLIERHISKLSKTPKHLAVILTADKRNEVEPDKLANLVTWALTSGVNFITFYDFRGIVKRELSSTLQSFVRRNNMNESEKIVWGPDCPKTIDGAIKYPQRNGYTRYIVVNLYSSDDCHEQFNQLLTQELCPFSRKRSACKSSEITVDLIDERLSKLPGYLPDPELAVFFGTFCCTQGFFPWQIRLTEFIQISYTQESLTLQKYLDVLYKYAKCQQRFGQ